MFSAASCGLSLLCEEALYSSESESASPCSSPVLPKRQCTHNKRVSFLSRDKIRVFEPLLPLEELDLLVDLLNDNADDLPETSAECGSESDDEVRFGVLLERRLAEAELNMERNKAPFRYQRTVASGKNHRRRRDGALYPDGSEIYGRSYAASAAASGPFPVASQAALDWIVATWMQQSTAIENGAPDATGPDIAEASVAVALKAPGGGDGRSRHSQSG